MKNETKTWITAIAFLVAGFLLEFFSDFTNKENFLIILPIVFGVGFGYYVGIERGRRDFAKRTKEVKK